MEKYSAICVGGPEDGKMMAHWGKKKPFYGLNSITGFTEYIGEYEYSIVWRWRPVKNASQQ